MKENFGCSVVTMRGLHVVKLSFFFLYVAQRRRDPRILQKGWRQQALKGHAGVALP